MSIRRIAFGAALAITALVGSTAASFAYDAYASTGVKVRSGHGYNYDQVGSLYAGQKVSVDHCEYNWCYVSWGKYYGWVYQDYLADHYNPPAYHSGGSYNPPSYHGGSSYSPPKHNSGYGY